MIIADWKAYYPLINSNNGSCLKIPLSCRRTYHCKSSGGSNNVLQCFSTFFLSRHPLSIISLFGASRSLNKSKGLWNWFLVAPLTLSHNTLVCRGTPVENHWHIVFEWPTSLCRSFHCQGEKWKRSLEWGKTGEKCWWDSRFRDYRIQVWKGPKKVQSYKTYRFFNEMKI